MPLAIFSEKIGPLEIITYLVACTDKGEALVVDPGGPAPALLARLRQENWRLRWIVNTHGHADHTAGNDHWVRETGAPVVMHRLDWEFFSRPEMQAMAQAEGFPPLTRVDLPVEDGQSLHLGDWEAAVIHTPGHTPGSICLAFPGHLFTGDTLFVEAAGRIDLPGGSLDSLIRSLQEKIMPLPDDTVIWPGHDYGGSPNSTLGQEKENNPFLTDFF
ncbi:MAG: MBL fold metallo-hydrolase [Deltaproteobacteria bacterium]|nr:MBL fold metallo-hydrolase [Deltaproteobacteria bacterium]